MTHMQRWDPFSDITSMHSQLDDMFNNFFGSGSMPASSNAVPAMDVYTDDDKALIAEVHAPGFNKDDVTVNIHDGILEIKGEKSGKEEEGKQGKRNYMLRESHESFYRRIALPRQADGDGIKAQFQDGVLKVTVPFKELPKPTKVEITSGKK